MHRAARAWIWRGERSVRLALPTSHLVEAIVRDLANAFGQSCARVIPARVPFDENLCQHQVLRFVERKRTAQNITLPVKRKKAPALERALDYPDLVRHLRPRKLDAVTILIGPEIVAS